jgi:hypothetical protein
VEDRWPDCWMVEAALPDDQTVSARCGAVPATLDALDPSWSGDRDIRLVTPCAFPGEAGALEVVTDALQHAGWATNRRAALRP